MSEAKTKEYLERYMEGVKKKKPGSPSSSKSVYEVAATVFLYIADKPQYHEMQILERMAEPERVISFRVPWTDDKGHIRTNRGWRVQLIVLLAPTKEVFVFILQSIKVF